MTTHTAPRSTASPGGARRAPCRNARVFATTVIRCAPEDDITGHLVEIDWAANRVLRSIPVPIGRRMPAWNDRGGNRGGRGVAVHNGRLYVATVRSVLVYDLDLSLEAEIAHPLLLGLHEIAVDDGGVWCTSTVHDLVIRLGFDGGVLDECWASECEPLQRALGFAGRRAELERFRNSAGDADAYEAYVGAERLHINSIAVHDGAVYALSCWTRSLLRIAPGPARVVFTDGALEAPHNCLVLPDGRVAVNNTKRQRVHVYELPSGDLIDLIATPVAPPNAGGSRQFAAPGWQRGMALLGGATVLVGTSPATVFELDLDRRALGQRCTLSDDAAHCIFGLAVHRDPA